MSDVETQQSYRVLWAQVVLQAKADLENEPIGSIIFNQAAAFFVGRGDWAQSRVIVADCLNIHPEALSRCGERWIADRREREGLEPEPKRERGPGERHPLPRLEALPGPAKPGGKSRRIGGSGKGNPRDSFREKAAAISG